MNNTDDNNLIQQRLRLHTFTTEKHALVWSHAFESEILSHHVELAGFPADYLEDIFLFSVSGARVELHYGGGQASPYNGRIYINVELQQQINGEIVKEVKRICIYLNLI